MNNGMDKGFEIVRIHGISKDRKMFDMYLTLMPYLIFLTIPLIAAVMYSSPKFEGDDRNTIITISVLFDLILCMVMYFPVEMISSRIRSPIIVYSKGIEYDGGYIDRINHKPVFTPWSLIKAVEVSEHTFTDAKGAATSRVHVVIRLTNGRIKEVMRKPDNMNGFKESITKVGAIFIDRGAVVNGSPVDKSKSSNHLQTVTVKEGNHFCGGCGTKLLEGAAFCGKCGRKV